NEEAAKVNKSSACRIPPKLGYSRVLGCSASQKENKFGLIIISYQDVAVWLSRMLKKAIKCIDDTEAMKAALSVAACDVSVPGEDAVFPGINDSPVGFSSSQPPLTLSGGMSANRAQKGLNQFAFIFVKKYKMTFKVAEECDNNDCIVFGDYATHGGNK
uniref:Uncharacterized protein n=1 Tax=Echinococcus canadensis TaxID=519352 RepID=A0A915F0B8_9CEST